MYRVTRVATGVAGTPYYLTGYFDQAGGTAQQAATDWATFVSTVPLSYSTPYRYESINTVDIVDPGTGDLLGISAVTVGSVQFTGSGDPLPPATTLLCGWRTGVYVGGREIRGRTNISRLAETTSDAGAPNSAILADYQARITALLASNNSTFVVYSRTQGQWAEVTQGYVGNKWAILRSRRD